MNILDLYGAVTSGIRGAFGHVSITSDRVSFTLYYKEKMFTVTIEEVSSQPRSKTATASAVPDLSGVETEDGK